MRVYDVLIERKRFFGGGASELTIAYNHLNLPNSFVVSGQGTITMTYTADGEKLTKVAGTSTKNYVGGIEYAGASVEAIYHAEGRCIPNGTTAFFYEYTLKDHLGNARINFRASGTIATFLEELHYYPFGMLMEGIGTPAVTQNGYKYNSKELNNDFGLGLYDYGARWYDAAVGRWSAVDMLASKYVNWSTYNYTMGNPVKLIDPNGMEVSEINGGYRFTGSDAVFAFNVLKADYGNRQEKDESKKYTGSVGIITFGKEKVWGEAMKALIPEAIMENVPAEDGQGGFDDFYNAVKSISDQSSDGIGFLAVFSHGGMDGNLNRSTYGEGMIFANADIHPNASNVYILCAVRICA